MILFILCALRPDKEFEIPVSYLGIPQKVTSSLNFRLFAIQCIVSVVRSVLTNIDGLDRLHSLQARLKALFKDCHVNIKLSMKCWEMTFLGSKGRFALFFLFYHFE